jgi:hypothetical protein
MEKKKMFNVGDEVCLTGPLERFYVIKEIIMTRGDKYLYKLAGFPDVYYETWALRKVPRLKVGDRVKFRGIDFGFRKLEDTYGIGNFSLTIEEFPLRTTATLGTIVNLSMIIPDVNISDIERY